MDTKDLSKVQKDRNVKLEKLRSEGFDYPNDFEKKYDISYLVEKFGNFSKDELEKKYKELLKNIDLKIDAKIKRLNGDKTNKGIIETIFSYLNPFESLNNKDEDDKEYNEKMIQVLENKIHKYENEMTNDK